jgi:hypothetical protein
MPYRQAGQRLPAKRPVWEKPHRFIGISFAFSAASPENKR